MNTPYRRTMMAACTIAVAITLLHGCTTGRKALHAAEFLPPTPHYDDATQWYITDRHADADIFYITSTETGDYLHADGTPCHYADTYIDSLRNPILGEMEGVDRLLSGALNFYSPYYRQCSMQTFTSDSTIAVRMPVATNDIKKAFRHYLKHLNNQRPFILAGYSQGAMILLELLKEMDKQTYSRMIAAYAVGVSIPKEVANAIPHLIPAQAADDLGVTICYNSAKNAAGTIPIFDNNTIAINPVNWRTDGQEATLITEPSPAKPLGEQKKDTMTVKLDRHTNYLFVEGFTDQDYVLPLIGKDGNLHTREIWLYRQQLHDNIALRTARFLATKNRISRK